MITGYQGRETWTSAGNDDTSSTACFTEDLELIFRRDTFHADRQRRQWRKEQFSKKAVRKGALVIKG